MKIVRFYLIGTITSDAATLEEINAAVAARVEETKKISREFVKALTSAGVKVESSGGSFEPRPGAHGAVDGVDFLAEAPAPAVAGVEPVAEATDVTVVTPAS